MRRVRRLAVPGGQALDAGAGAGSLALKLAGAGFRVTAVDGSEAFAARLGERLAAAPGGPHRALRGDMSALSVPDAAFDLVTCAEVLEHLEDDAAAARELHRAARPGGLLLVTVPAGPHRMDWTDRWAGHHRRYDVAGLERCWATRASWTSTCAAGASPSPGCTTGMCTGPCWAAAGAGRRRAGRRGAGRGHRARRQGAARPAGARHAVHRPRSRLVRPHRHRAAPVTDGGGGAAPPGGCGACSAWGRAAWRSRSWSTCWWTAGRRCARATGTRTGRCWPARPWCWGSSTSPPASATWPLWSRWPIAARRGGA